MTKISWDKLPKSPHPKTEDEIVSSPAPAIKGSIWPSIDNECLELFRKLHEEYENRETLIYAKIMESK